MIASQQPTGEKTSALVQRPFFLFLLYQLGWHLLLPLVGLRLWWRGRKDRGYWQHLPERLSFTGLSSRFHHAIWIHAVSVGETRAAEPLILAYLARGEKILLTCMTPNGRRTGQALYASAIATGQLRQCYLPYDICWAVEHFIKQVQPKFGLFIETEAWPTYVFRCAEMGLPLFLINARLSDRSARRIKYFGRAGEELFQAFTGILAQTELDAERYRALGVKNCAVFGNLKFDVLMKPELLELGAGWQANLRTSGRLVVCAASTRIGEEQLILTAWQQVLKTARIQPQPLLFIVPRHPERFDEVAKTILASGFRLRRRSEATERSILFDQTDVFLGDSMGEMAAYYRAADLVVMGGSLLSFGGQNLIEACAVDCPVIVGEHTFNFQQATLDAINIGAAVRITPAQLSSTLVELLLSTEQRLAMAFAAKNYANLHQGATKKILHAIDEQLRRKPINSAAT